MSGLSRRFAEILDTQGWPGKRLVGSDGAEAAWTLALHTMHDPNLLRRCLRLMLEAVGKGDAEPRHVAHLVDRMSLVERNSQVYGTTICRNETGGFDAPLLEDPELVDQRRQAVGLEPLNHDVRRIEAYYRRSA